MVMFPSDEWCKALSETLNHSPEFAKAGKDGVSTVVWVISPEGSLTKPVRIFISFDHGQVPEAYVMAEGETREAEHTSTASFGV